MINAVKIVRLVMTVFLLAILLVSYAYLPLTIDTNLDTPRLGRDHFFYGAMGLFLVLNLITYFLRFFVDRINAPQYSRVAVHALAPVLYFAMTLLIGFLALLNNASATEVEPADFFYLNYLSSFVLIAWFVVFLFVSIRKV